MHYWLSKFLIKQLCNISSTQRSMRWLIDIQPRTLFVTTMKTSQQIRCFNWTWYNLNLDSQSSSYTTCYLFIYLRHRGMKISASTDTCLCKRKLSRVPTISIKCPLNWSVIIIFFFLEWRTVRVGGWEAKGHSFLAFVVVDGMRK